MKSYSKAVTVALTGLTVGVAACGGTDAAPATGDQRLEGNSEVVTTTAESPGEAAWVLEVAPEGNAARYRVREQLVGVDLPNDAVGTTDRVSGRIGLDAQGNTSQPRVPVVLSVAETIGLEYDFNLVVCSPADP